MRAGRWAPCLLTLLAAAAGLSCASAVAEGMIFARTVTNTNDSGAGSLRQAITEVNLNGTGLIFFNIAGAGPHTITPATALPQITAPCVIAGYSQPGSSVNTVAQGTNAVLKIEINGSDALPGLDVNAACLIQGLAINHCTPAAIRISANGSVIMGSFIGTDVTGTLLRENPGRGIELFGGASSNLIGGTDFAARNLIAGSGPGIQVVGSDNRIEGNLIGTNASGNGSLPNRIGIVLWQPNNTVGGTTDAARNIISGNDGAGVIIQTADGRDNKIQGNFIGTNAAGTAALPNAGGVIIGPTVTGSNLIGGDTLTPGLPPGNVISGNHKPPVLASGVELQNTGGVAATEIKGNLIGTDLNGTAAIPNGDAGVRINGTYVLVDNNVLSGNRYGVSMVGGALINVANNRIGTDISGVSALPNTLDGIYVDGATSVEIGQVAGGPNTIAFNAQFGVTIFGTSRARLSRNSIHSNGGIGINLDGPSNTAGGVTFNDPGDADSGPNDVLNFPVLTGVSTTGGVRVTGTLNTTPNRTVDVEIFRSSAADPGGWGEGETFLGSGAVTTDASGNGTFTFTFSGATISPGEVVTAVTSDSGTTSEFSRALVFGAVNQPPVLTNPGPQTGTVGTAFSLQLEAMDPDGGALTFGATGLPTGITITAGGLISGTPNAAGPFNISATVSDGSLSDTEAFTLTVAPAPPPGKIVVSKKALSFKVAGPRTKTLSTTVSNQGKGPLTVTVGSSAFPFAVTAGGGSFTLAPKARRNVSILFSPTSAGSFSGTLAIASSDPRTPLVNVKLKGKATGSF